MGFVTPQNPALDCLPIELHEWFLTNMPDENLLWKESAKDQIIFVRDRLARRFCPDRRAAVIGLHLSKSVLLPVYELRLKNGIILVARDNFYDWKVSIESPFPINRSTIEGFVNSSRKSEFISDNFREIP